MKIKTGIKAGGYGTGPGWAEPKLEGPSGPYGRPPTP